MAIGLFSVRIHFVAASAQIVVAPSGDDSNPGTPEKPLATLSAAQKAVCEQVAAGLEADVVVHLGRVDGPPVRLNGNRREWYEWEGNIEGDPLLSSSLDVPHDDIFEPDRLTIEAWINPAEIPDRRRWWIVNKNENEGRDGHYALLVSGSRVRGVVNIGGGWDNRFHADSPEDVLAAGVWQHVAMSYDRAVLRVYHNGVERGSTQVNRARSAGSARLAVGHRADDASLNSPFRFKGFIDGVRVHDRALDAGEIGFSFANPGDLPSRPPVAAWSFEDIVASAVADAQERALHYQTYLQALAKAGLRSASP